VEEGVWWIDLVSVWKDRGDLELLVDHADVDSFDPGTNPCQINTSVSSSGENMGDRVRLPARSFSAICVMIEDLNMSLRAMNLVELLSCPIPVLKMFSRPTLRFYNVLHSNLTAISRELLKASIGYLSQSLLRSGSSSHAPGRNQVSKRCDDHLVGILRYGDFFEDVSLDSVYLLRGPCADFHAVFDTVPFLLYSSVLSRLFARR